ncbi:MAG: tRNA-uridine aminocarboxypropyltransferase [Clostridium sp.]|jgi:hypothetical protein
MFKRKKEPLFGNNIEPDCSYCAHGPGPAETCPYRQVDKDDATKSCRAFQYDPLMRAPYAPPPLKKHDPGEFEI